MSGRALDPEQRSRLLSAKLGALVQGRWGTGDGLTVADRESAAFGGGAALCDGSTAWILVDDPTTFGLGSVLAWASHRGVRDVVVIADEPGDLARHATYFSNPPLVFAANGRDLLPAIPAPLTEADAAPPNSLAMAAVLAAAGLDVVVEHGVVTGEVLGLEVARVVSNDDGTARVEVGVGRNDREAFTMLHGNLPPEDAIRLVAEAVRRHRRAGAPSHPLNRLGSERWLLNYLQRESPEVKGWRLDPIPGPVARVSVNDHLPAFATGTDADGVPVVLACSVGIDLELVPRAADVRRALHLERTVLEHPASRLILALPTRDAHGATRALAAALVEPAEVLSIEGDWRR